MKTRDERRTKNANLFSAKDLKTSPHTYIRVCIFPNVSLLLFFRSSERILDDILFLDSELGLDCVLRFLSYSCFLYLYEILILACFTSVIHTTHYSSTNNEPENCLYVSLAISEHSGDNLIFLSFKTNESIFTYEHTEKVFSIMTNF